MTSIIPYKSTLPTINDNAWIAKNATVIGNTHIGADSNIWFGVTIRGDVHKIRIGARTNIQDNSVVHVTRGTGPTNIGDDVTIGHGAVIHACTIGDLCLIGMGAVLLDNCVIESGAMVAAGAVVTPRKTIPSGQLWGGNTARYMRDLTPEETAFLKTSADNYVQLSRTYKTSN